MTASGAISWMPGHGSKLAGWDPGAISPAGWTEAWLVRRVAAAGWLTCEDAQVQSEVIAAGDYGQRGRDAEAGTGSLLVIQLHADAAPAEVGPDVARVFWYPNGQQAAALAIAAELRKVVPWRVDARCADASWKNAQNCLASVGPGSVLVELGFTDGADGRHKLPALAEAMGQAVARGALAWRVTVHGV